MVNSETVSLAAHFFFVSVEVLFRKKYPKILLKMIEIW